MNKTILVEGMKCQGCADTVKEKLEAVAGIENAEVDLSGKQVMIACSREVSLDELRASLAGSKFVIPS